VNAPFPHVNPTSDHVKVAPAHIHVIGDHFFPIEGHVLMTFDRENVRFRPVNAPF